jgi:glucose/mannose-6-phosphate isomerase
LWVGTVTLNDINLIREHDKANMLEKIMNLPDHIDDIITKIETMDLSTLSSFEPKNVLILGMGGSAISGEILSSWLDYECDLNIATVRNYSVPACATKDSLVFAISYSGNTEETLSAVHEAHSNGCKIIAITSGGKLAEFCQVNHVPIIDIPTGIAPRAAVGFLLFPMIAAMVKLEILRSPVDFKEITSELRILRGSMAMDVETENNPAKQLAETLSEGVPYIYSYSYMNVIAYRWKTQFNENAKILAFNGEIPEMNHNEIVGWAGDNQKIANKFIVVFLRNPDEHPRVTKRFELTKKILSAITKDVIEIEAKGTNNLMKMLNTLYLGDFTSAYLAILRGVDPTPVIPIDRLKKAMQE